MKTNYPQLPNRFRQIMLFDIPVRYTFNVLFMIDSIMNLPFRKRVGIAWRLLWGLPVVLRAQSTTDEVNTIFNKWESYIKRHNCDAIFNEVSPFDNLVTARHYEMFKLYSAMQNKREKLEQKNPNDILRFATIGKNGISIYVSKKITTW